MTAKKIIPKLLSYFERPYTAWLPRSNKKAIKKLDYIDIDVVSHCNLKCKGCSHFSPIAAPAYLDVNKYEQDINQLRKIVPENKLGNIFLIGGEPLLHPEIIKFITISRKAYQKIPIIIITNGILLLKQPDSFWSACRTQDITVEITRYPITLDFEPIFAKAKQESVKLVFRGRTKYYRKKQYYLPLDVKGERIAEKSFRHCFMARHCFNLSDGKVFPCSYIACVGRFNEHFDQNIPVVTGDYADIYQCSSFEELAESLNGPYPMCRYCAVDKRTYGNEWDVSKKDIREWSI